MTKNLPYRQRCSLPRREYGRVSRVLQHVKCVQKQPHRVGWVGKPPVGEGVSRKQIAEFVVTDRRRQGQNGEQREAQGNDSEWRADQHCPLPDRDARTESFDSAKPSIAQSRR